MRHDQSSHEGSGLSRREFLTAAGGALLAGEVLAAAQRVEEEKPMDVTCERVTFKSGEATVGGLLCRPQAEGRVPGVIVIHENRGLTDYIQDIARQLAQAGYAALAVNLCSRALGPESEGGTDAARTALGDLSTEDALQDLGAGVDYLKQQDFVRAEKIGCVGFCYGGRMSLLLACHRPDLSAAVVFYGRPADALPLIPELKAAVLGNFGEEDGSIPPTAVRELEAALQQHDKTYDLKIYPGAGHAFHRPEGNRYHEAAARDAWHRTIAWFDRYLAG